MADYDYLIVGQGIAGTMLAHFLLTIGKSIIVADAYNPSSASNIAAGICNPITGRRLVKTWKADVIFPFAENTYTELEELLVIKIWFKKNIVKVLSGKNEVDLFNSKKNLGEFSQLTGPYLKSQPGGLKIEEAFEITGAGYLDMAKLIAAYRKMLLKEEMLIETTVRNDDLTLEKESVSWKDRRFGKVIFCDGYKAAENSFFSWLPFVLAKGEALIIESNDLHLDKILNKDIFILPLGKNLYKIGSTYQWDKLDENPTVEGKNQLIRKMDLLLDCAYTIVDHLVGIRPTVKDRKPFLGIHPNHPQIGIFNGLGAKGASLAPYFANHFVEFLEKGKVLDPDVDINRFRKQSRTF